MPLRALAPQASASANSATRTRSSEHGTTGAGAADYASTVTDTRTAEDKVVDICGDLVRIDSSNYGDGSGPGERVAAEYVATVLADAGLAPVIVESEPGRANVIARWEGADPNRDALLVHGHLDVVPAVAGDWQSPPFAADVRDGYLWGRGTVDMKGMDAMILSVVEELSQAGETPPRDIVLAFTADEEAGGALGAGYLTRTHRGAFDGVSEAISEVGGFSVTVDERRIYLLQTAEKGILWLRLTAHGRAGHGSHIHPDNVVTRLAGAIARIGEHAWPLVVTATPAAMAQSWQEITGRPLPLDDPIGLRRELGSTATWVEATLHNTANPTVLTAGYKHNVVPATASALLDVRFVPGHEDEVTSIVSELAGEGIDIEVVHRDVALETGFDGALVDAMSAALIAEDPGAGVVPYCMSGGTDNKHYSRLGIRGFGFAPLRLPPDLDFAALFHGVDERVPVDALRFGAATLRRLIRTC